MIVSNRAKVEPIVLLSSGEVKSIGKTGAIRPVLEAMAPHRRRETGVFKNIERVVHTSKEVWTVDRFFNEPANSYMFAVCCLVLVKTQGSLENALSWLKQLMAVLIAFANQ